MSKINLVLDMSKYDMFQLCPCRFNYRYNLNKELPTKAKPLDKGTLVHLGAETYYKHLKSGSKFEPAVMDALEKIKIAGATATDLSATEISRIVDVMIEYFDRWRIADQMFEIVAVEEPFIYELYNDEVMSINISGKIDLIISDNRYSNLPMDHKSYEREWPVNEMSNQFKNYCYALKSNIFYVNRIGFQKTIDPEIKHKRVPISYDPFILDQWKDNVIKVCKNVVLAYAENVWTMNETSCDKFNRECEYKRLCLSSGEPARLYKLTSDYKDAEVWDVTRSLMKTSQLIEEKMKEYAKEAESRSSS